MPSAQRKPTAPERPISIGGLAERLGISRQRVYNLVRRGQIRAEPMSGSLVIQPEEAARVIDAATRVDTRTGRNRLVFDFV
jgi:excisionase family DNA binding protein